MHRALHFTGLIGTTFIRQRSIWDVTSSKLNILYFPKQLIFLILIGVCLFSEIDLTLFFHVGPQHLKNTGSHHNLIRSSVLLTRPNYPLALLLVSIWELALFFLASELAFFVSIYPLAITILSDAGQFSNDEAVK